MPIQSQINFIAEARRVLDFFKAPEWAVSEEKTDQEHVADFAATLAKTRDHHDLPEKTAMHMAMGEGEIVLALVGNTPDAAERARGIVAFLRSMPHLLDQLEKDIAKFVEDRDSI